MMMRSGVAGVLVILMSLAVCALATREMKSFTAQNNTPQVPVAIRVDSGYKLKLLLSASGDQYYRYNGTSWVNYSAKARLYNQEKKQVARHFYLRHADRLGGQPSWETLPSHGVPESLVTGVAVSKCVVDADSIAWVLLKATNHTGDKNYFGDVEYVQRLDTSQGVAPSSTASNTHEGDVWVSSYTADYAFYVRN